MKKVFSHITSNMIRPICYQCVTKCAFALAILLLWDRFVNPLGMYRAVRDGFFLVGIFFLLMAWFSYLWLDGMRMPKFVRRERKKKTRNRTRDVVDFVDEHVTSLDELSDEERHACGFCSSMLAAVIFMLPSLGLLIFTLDKA